MTDKITLEKAKAGFDVLMKALDGMPIYLSGGSAIVRACSEYALRAWSEPDLKPPVFTKEFFDNLLAPFGLDNLDDDDYARLEDELVDHLIEIGGIPICCAWALAHTLQHAFERKAGTGQVHH